MTQIVLATHNAKKLVELRRIVEPRLPEVRVLGLDDFPAYTEPAETELTFTGNALLKARAAVERTGAPAVGDDSGLCVDALNGMPGVLSARWSGHPRSDQRNLDLLLDQLQDVADQQRGAKFSCCVALVLPDGSEHVVEGEVRGRIVREPRGDGGFGYDPVFCPDGHDQTMAELDAAAKDELSHRGRALRALLPTLAKVLT